MFKSIEITHEIRKPRNPSLKDPPATLDPYPPRQPRKLYRASRLSKNYFYCNTRISSNISINHLSPFFCCPFENIFYYLCGWISRSLLLVILGILERGDRENARHILSISSSAAVSSQFGFVVDVSVFRRDKSFT